MREDLVSLPRTALKACGGTIPLRWAANRSGEPLRPPPVYRAYATTCNETRPSLVPLVTAAQTAQRRPFHRVITPVLPTMDKIVAEKTARPS